MNPLLTSAIQFAQGASSHYQRARQQAPTIHYKGQIDLVTDTDHAVEAYLVDSIRQKYPDHAILAEEGGTGTTGQAEFEWVIDPIDGTTNFAHGYPYCGVSIAITRWNTQLNSFQPWLGVVYNPFVQELFYAELGKGAWQGEQKLAVSQTTSLDRSLLVTGFPYDRRSNPDNNLEHFSRIQLMVQDVRRLGSAALDLCHVANGQLDGYWELRMKPWDIAAGGVILAEAGGRMTDWAGNANWYKRVPVSVIASNGHIQSELFQALTHTPLSK
ncbi:MAG TPA: inositol monophosphatase family protein [Anaerolineales bacterium]|nr:inositol monophosphatase family protein [Anaerolineales bacterium]